ncbi:MAG: hypothetical protein C5B51_25745 [Terriglobia bacterium]|nr:MAG: hypothetical protein C5B51_25745 [Terriglobia bacterium]
MAFPGRTPASGVTVISPSLRAAVKVLKKRGKIYEKRGKQAGRGIQHRRAGRGLSLGQGLLQI